MILSGPEEATKRFQQIQEAYSVSHSDTSFLPSKRSCPQLGSLISDVISGCSLNLVDQLRFCRMRRSDTQNVAKHHGRYGRYWKIVNVLHCICILQCFAQIKQINEGRARVELEFWSSGRREPGMTLTENRSWGAMMGPARHLHDLREVLAQLVVARRFVVARRSSPCPRADLCFVRFVCFVCFPRRTLSRRRSISTSISVPVREHWVSSCVRHWHCDTGFLKKQG